MEKDVVIVGAGPAGIFTALEMLRKGSKQSILLIEKGSRWKNAIAPRPRSGTV